MAKRGSKPQVDLGKWNVPVIGPSGNTYYVSEEEARILTRSFDWARSPQDAKKTVKA